MPADMELRIAGIENDSIVDGEGCRFTIFVQGCPRRCRNCHNEAAQNFDGGVVVDTEEIVKKIAANPLLDGVTFSGGEPFCQGAPLTEIADKVHAMGLNVWVYSGNTFEELASSADENVKGLLNAADVLVDGEYMDELRDLSLKFRGSSNQRIIDLNKTRAAHAVVLY